MGINNQTLCAGFIFLLIIRLFTEYIDRTFQLALTPVISALFLPLGLLIVLAGRVFDRQGLVLGILWLCISVSAICSAVFSPSPFASSSWSQVYKYMTYAIIPLVGYVIGGHQASKQKLAWALICYAVLAYGFAIYEGVFELGMTAIVDETLVRSLAFSSHPVLFGLQIYFTLGLLLYLALEQTGLTKKQANFFLLMALGALFFTYARTAWLMVMLVLTAYFKEKLLRLKVIAPLLLILCAVFVGGLGQPVIDRFQDLKSLYSFVHDRQYAQQHATSFVDSSMHWRVLQWYGLIQVAKEHLVTGVGPGQVKSYNVSSRSAHSSLVEMFVEQGLLGFLLILLFYMLCLRIAFKPANRHQRFLSVTVVLGFIAASLFSVSLHNQTTNMMLFLLFLGLVAAGHSDAKKSGVVTNEDLQ